MLDIHRQGDIMWWTFRRDSPTCSAWRVDSMTAEEMWSVYDVRLAVGQELKPGMDANGLVLAPVGPRTKLLGHAALNGFCHMTVYYLRKLREMFVKVSFSRGHAPKTEMDWVRALAKEVLGDITPEMWQHMCERRNRDAKHELVKECLLAQAGGSATVPRELGLVRACRRAQGGLEKNTGSLSPCHERQQLQRSDRSIGEQLVGRACARREEAGED